VKKFNRVKKVIKTEKNGLEELQMRYKDILFVLLKVAKDLMDLKVL
jgi:archaellum component FlaC